MPHPSTSSAYGIWSLNEIRDAVRGENWPFRLGFYPLTINQSLRFNDNDSAYLSRTPASAGNSKTWTWSGWVKRGNLGSWQMLWAAGTSAGDRTYLSFDDQDYLVFNHIAISSPVFYLTSDRVFRDSSSWYHIVLESNLTNTDVNIYVNGEEIGLTVTSGSVQNVNTYINNSTAHFVSKSSFADQEYLDGYLSEVHFTDGTAYDATAFGEFKSGVWVAKTPSVTYGTNGFYLDFADSSAIGHDESGNANDWTPNNFTASDVVSDSPTNNFATLNPIAKDSDVTLSDGNLTFTCDGGGTSSTGGVIGTVAVSSGKWYGEFTLVSGNTGTGIGVAELPLSSYAADPAGSYVYLQGGSKRIGPSTTSSYGASFTNGDVIGVALDMDAGTVEFYKNNVSQGVAFTGLSGDFAFYLQDGSTSSSPVVNTNFGQQDFTYTPPTDYLALSTANLSVPAAIDPALSASPQDYFNTIIYSGDGTQSVTGVGFQPDFVWVKSRSNAAYNHQLHDAVRGATSGLLASNSTAAENSTYQFDSFDSDGFTTDSGNITGVNNTGQTFAAWNWKANGSGVSNTDGTITSTVSANTDVGFSIVSYTGTGSGTPSIGHGLNQKPDFWFLKDRDNLTDWISYTQQIDGSLDFVRLNNQDAKQDSANPAPTDSVFYVSGPDLNNSGAETIAYVFHSVEGFSKFGIYTGNGSADGPFVYTGFKPAFILVRRTDSTADWAIFDATRNTFNAFDKALVPNSTGAEVNTTFGDMLSNGFKWRYTGAQNTSGGTYIFAAFAENPFKYSNAR